MKKYIIRRTYTVHKDEPVNHIEYATAPNSCDGFELWDIDIENAFLFTSQSMVNYDTGMVERVLSWGLKYVYIDEIIEIEVAYKKQPDPITVQQAIKGRSKGPYELYRQAIPVNPTNLFSEQSDWIIANNCYNVAELSPRGIDEKEHYERLCTAAYLVHTANMHDDLVDAIKNLLGCFDNPVVRRKLGIHEFRQEAIEFAKNQLSKAQGICPEQNEQ